MSEGIVSNNTEITYETSHHFDLKEGETNTYNYFKHGVGNNSVF